MEFPEEYKDRKLAYYAGNFNELVGKITPDVIKDYAAGFTDFYEGEDVLGLIQQKR